MINAGIGVQHLKVKKNENIHDTTTAKVEVEKEKWSQDDFSGQPHQIHSIIDNDDESLDVRDDDTVQIDEVNSVKAEEGVLSFETLEDLGNFTSSILRKEKLRFSKVDVKEESFLITPEEWSQMIKNRSKYHFGNSNYSEIILCKLRTLYSGCVPCVGNNYLKKKSEVVKLCKSDKKDYEGYVSIYCRHANCSECNVMGKVSFHSYADKIEGVATMSDRRSHYKTCLKSRPATGKRRDEILRKLESERPYSLYRHLQNYLTEEERVFGAHTYAPSQEVLRNLKSQGNISKRYSDNWIINIEIMAEISSKTFVRDFTVRPPGIILYTDAQIKTHSEICRKDIIYLDATGSVMKKFAHHKDHQIYTLLVRHPYAGGPSLPVATNITTRHDAGSIRRFLEIFLNDALKLCGSKTKPIMIMIDGSKAMWNAVLRAFPNETRLCYYDRC